MAVCPTCFKTQYQLEHRAVITDVIVVVPVPGALGIGIQFDKPMDQSVMPDALTLEVEIDSVTYPCTPSAWSSATQLNCSTTASSPVTDAYVRQLKQHVNLRSLAGIVNRKQSDLQWYP
jgi:hypothetical protein